ncbi:MAG: phosphate regulon transcriptional regulator PhoB [Gammaproteobacteria bacterium]|nr:phosphate regulon transcriptional regulator PhoB [Gammaproteobacteria bacterium]
MKEIHLLIVEDEPAIRDMLDFSLDHKVFRLSMVENTAQARQIVLDDPPDLIVLDWMLPGESGVEFARYLKSQEFSKEIPVIMLTAKGEEDDKIRGLEAGADDYVTKPFSPRELSARIKAVLRRGSSATTTVFEFEALVLDVEAHRLTIDKQLIELGPTEFRLFKFLLSHPERVYSRGQLLDRVWGNNVYVEERTVDVHIRRLRKALGNSGYDKYVQTVRGAGYRFSKQV